jgi:hypothetical protein
MALSGCNFRGLAATLTFYSCRHYFDIHFGRLHLPHPLFAFLLGRKCIFLLFIMGGGCGGRVCHTHFLLSCWAGSALHYGRRLGEGLPHPPFAFLELHFILVQEVVEGGSATPTFCFSVGLEVHFIFETRLGGGSAMHIFCQPVQGAPDC